jgi:hypothetical protein
MGGGAVRRMGIVLCIDTAENGRVELNGSKPIAIL